METYQLLPVPQRLLGIGGKMRTQDNACTRDPLFVVFDKKRVTGFDPQYTDDHLCWVDTDSGTLYVEGDRRFKVLERYYRRFGQEPYMYTRTAYKDFDEFKTACFTDQAAQAYIAANRHNLHAPHIFVETLNRNPEMIAVRTFLEAL